MAIDATTSITAAKLKDKLFQEQIILDILRQAQGYGSLAVEGIVKRAKINGTQALLPTMSAVTVTEDLAELVAADVDSPDFASVPVTLKANEIRVAFSDESLMNPNVADPISLVRTDASVSFARSLDRKVATALAATPQAGTAWNPSSASFLKTVAEAAALLGNYKMTGIAAGVEAYGEIIANVYAGANRTNNLIVENGITKLPGYEVPIHVSTALPTDAMYFVSTEAPGVYVLEGQVKNRLYDDPDHRATVLQADVYNAVVSNLRQTTGSLNAGAVKVTLAE